MHFAMFYEYSADYLDRRAQFRQAVADADRSHVVARCAQAADDVEFSPALGRRLFGDALERLRRHQRLVNQDKDAQPRHGAQVPRARGAASTSRSASASISSARASPALVSPGNASAP